MWLMCANHDEFELGEGYSVNAYSEDLERLKEYVVADALRQNGTILRFRNAERGSVYDQENDLVAEYEYCKDSWGIWCVLEEGEVPSQAVNVDLLP